MIGLQSVDGHIQLFGIALSLLFSYIVSYIYIYFLFSLKWKCKIQQQQTKAIKNG